MIYKVLKRQKLNLLSNIFNRTLLKIFACMDDVNFDIHIYHNKKELRDFRHFLCINFIVCNVFVIYKRKDGKAIIDY